MHITSAVHFSQALTNTRLANNRLQMYGRAFQKFLMVRHARFPRVDPPTG
jgi:hypothetical protein